MPGKKSHALRKIRDNLSICQSNKSIMRTRYVHDCRGIHIYPFRLGRVF